MMPEALVASSSHCKNRTNKRVGERNFPKGERKFPNVGYGLVAHHGFVEWHVGRSYAACRLETSSHETFVVFNLA